MGKAPLMTMDTTVRTTAILEVGLGDHAAFTESRAMTETLMTETLMTETTATFHLEGRSEEPYRAGLNPTHTWTDPAGDYSVTLATMPADRVAR